MLRTAVTSALFASALVFAGSAGPAAAGCPSDVAITSAKLKSIVPNGPVSLVNVAITVKNVGRLRQPGNTLQSVFIYQSEIKTSSKGIPPLAPGQTYSFIYSFQRSSEAPPHTTPLQLKLVVASPAGIECVSPNDFFSLSA